MKKRVFAVFQGGGARGIAHVGAISVLEDSRIELSGVGGTSAGAIVAALKSAGYSAKEMFDCESHEHIISLIDVNGGAAGGPKDLFGGGGWVAVMAAKWFYANLDSLAFAWVLCFFSLPFYAHVHFAFFCLFLVFLIATAAFAIWVIRGVSSLDGFVDALDQLLVRKVSNDNDSRVTFKDMADAGCLPLRIVATNVSDKCEGVFSADRTPNVAVAEAVAASACLPFVFRARLIDGKSYFDGGLVSNLPAWVFDEERALDPDAATVAVEIGAQVSEKPTDQKVSGFAALKSALGTALSGAEALEKRAVSNLVTIELDPKVGLLDFDMSPVRASSEVQNGENEAKLGLLSKIVTIPSQMDQVCELVAAEALRIINSCRARKELDELQIAPRVAFLRPPLGTSRSLEIKYSSGFQGFSDHGIVLPTENSFVGEAWNEKLGLFIDREDPDWNSTLDRASDQALRNRIKDSLEWIVAVYFNHQQVEQNAFVLALDGQESLCLEEDDYRGLLMELTVELQDLMDELVPLEVFQDGY
ncbi:MAG: patatin-like phospholipase family protein [Erythrobacter sp.]